MQKYEFHGTLNKNCNHFKFKLFFLSLQYEKEI